MIRRVIWRYGVLTMAWGSNLLQRWWCNEAEDGRAMHWHASEAESTWEMSRGVPWHYSLVLFRWSFHPTACTWVLLPWHRNPHCYSRARTPLHSWCLAYWCTVRLPVLLILHMVSLLTTLFPPKRTTASIIDTAAENFGWRLVSLGAGSGSAVTVGTALAPLLLGACSWHSLVTWSTRTMAMK
jgi:hypothetical protein